MPTTASASDTHVITIFVIFNVSPLSVCLSRPPFLSLSQPGEAFYGSLRIAQAASLDV